MKKDLSTIPFIPVTLWIALCVTAFLVRPLWPIDETRYVSVAWDMWQHHEFLVPHLNGIPYSQKPPLLFWLICVGWRAFGVNEWWPRLIAPLFTLGSLFLTYHIGQILWPDSRYLRTNSPNILLGTLFWSLFSTLVMFDMLVVFFTLICLFGLLHTIYRCSIMGWILLALGMCLGVLVKGPMIFLPVLPTAFLAPWWVNDKVSIRWRRWYAGVLASLLISIGIGFLWAIPAAYSGGRAYAHDILWSQMANRAVSSFAHAHSWWWYLPWLPVLLLPWPLSITFWRSLLKIRMVPQEKGARFCIVWIIPAFVLFSLSSGKQPYYLLSLLPGFGLLFGKAFEGAPASRWDALPYAIFLGLLGFLWLILPTLTQSISLPRWIAAFSPSIGILIIIICIGLVVYSTKKPRQHILGIATASILILIILHVGVLRAASPYYDGRPLALLLQKLQKKGFPVAHVGSYDGQYQFLGRLKRPLAVIRREELNTWLGKHVEGRAVLYVKNWPIKLNEKVEYVQPFRGKFAVLAVSPVSYQIN